jgi:hypothetical protein
VFLCDGRPIPRDVHCMLFGVCAVRCVCWQHKKSKGKGVSTLGTNKGIGRQQEGVSVLFGYPR